jgi:ribulose-5-phosphate 4-epimerase/fuculose-1-phosphate aldolase
MTVQSLTTATSPSAKVAFDREVAELLLRYGRMVVDRGYIHNTLGNIAIRVPHPDFADGVLYTKHSGVSLEEASLDNIVITDVPSGKLLYGDVPTSVGHNLNREILRLRPDINAVIHAHHDETIAFLAAGGAAVIKPMSLEYPYVLGMDPYVVPSNLDVEQDVGPIKEFVHRTNTIVMVRHGLTTLGRHVSEAYHRLNSLTSEVRRNVLTEILCSIRGTKPEHLSRDEVDWMYRYAEDVIYPSPNRKG